MDPNVTLRLIRAELASHREYGDGSAAVLVQHVQALDDWLSNGGFLPRPWEPRPRALPDDGTRRFAHNEPTPVEAIQRELDAHPTWGGNDHVLAGEEAVRYKDERVVRRALTRRNEATHPVELPDPAGEAAFFAARGRAASTTMAFATRVPWQDGDPCELCHQLGTGDDPLVPLGRPGEPGAFCVGHELCGTEQALEVR